MISRPLRALGVLFAVLLVGAARCRRPRGRRAGAQRGRCASTCSTARRATSPEPRRHALSARPSAPARRPRCWSRTASAAASDSVADEARDLGGARLRRPRLVGARVRREHRADRAGLPRLRGHGRPAAGRLARRPARGPPGRPRRPAGRRHGRLVRRRAVAAARRRRPARRRVVPVITWNDLGQALFPNRPAPTAGRRRPPRAPPRPDGVFKRAWAALFFGSGSRPAPGQEQAPPQVCGRFVPEVCAGYVAAVTTGREPADARVVLRPRLAGERGGRITAPTLLVQGEQDTLFGLDQADATARQIAAGGGTVAVSWFAGGHDGGEPDTAHHRRACRPGSTTTSPGTGPDPGAAFTYVVPVRRAGRRAPTQRTITASRLPRAARRRPDRPHAGMPLARRRPGRRRPGGRAAGRDLVGAGLSRAWPAARPAVATPATTRTTTAAAAAVAGAAAAAAVLRLARPPRERPPRPGRDGSAPTRCPRARCRRHPAGPARGVVGARPAVAGEPVLFAKVYDVAAGDGAPGTRTLLGNAVSPMRLPAPGPTPPTEVTVSLPGRRGDAGRGPPPRGRRSRPPTRPTPRATAPGRLPDRRSPGTPRSRCRPCPATSAAGPRCRSPRSSPPGVLLLGVLVAWLVARVLAVRRRRRATSSPAGALALEEELAGTPLVVRGLSKSLAERARRRRRPVVHRRARPGARPARPQRRGQDDHPAHADGPDPARRRARSASSAAGSSPGAPVLSRVGAFVEGAGLPAAPVRPRQPGAVLGGHRPPRRGRAPRGGPGDRRARRRPGPRGAHLLPGHAPAPRHRPGHARPARPAGPRRADQRPRPAPDPRDARGAEPLRRATGPHRHRLQPPAGRGRADLRPRGGHAPRPARRRRRGRRARRPAGRSPWLGRTGRRPRGEGRRRCSARRSGVRAVEATRATPTSCSSTSATRPRRRGRAHS